MDQLKKWLQIKLIKLHHWEYWNSNIVYLPIMPYLIFLWIKARSCFFFNAANPGIEYGGFLMESKWKIHTDAPDGFFPDTFLINPLQDIAEVSQNIVSRFSFPFIAKPDIGGKGRGVTVIHCQQDLEKYHAICPIPYIIQKKIDYPLEAGIFYVRMPGEPKGYLTGIVEKEFMHVIGDGRSALRELIVKNKRYILQLDALEKILSKGEMDFIVPLNERRSVIEIGNHARGSMFKDVSYRITEKLTDTMDNLCKRFPGFYFGRLDIRFESWELLEQGKNFAVIELNGSGSEPTHIYDPSNSIFKAWKEIIRHWNLLATISIYNHKQGIRYLTFSEGVKMLKDNAALNKKLSCF